MVVVAFSVLFLLAVIYLLVRPIVHGAIFFTSSIHNIDLMLGVASLRPSDRVADLGSGDGRIVIACARQGVRAEGYEINPLLVLLSRRAIRRAGVQQLATVHWKSFWRADLAPFNAVFVYGIPYIMNGLQKKLEQELRPGAKVISNIYSFHGWTPAEKRGGVYLYVLS